MSILGILHDYKLRAFDMLPAPVMNTPSVQGTTGSTTYIYCATFRTLVGETDPSAQMTVTNGNATLNGNNRIGLSVVQVPEGCLAVRYWKKVLGTFELLGEAVSNSGLLYDQGQAVTSAELPTVNDSGRPDWLFLLPNTRKRFQRAEMSDLQSMIFRAIANLSRTIFKDGDVISGLAPSLVSTNHWSFTAGSIAIEGFQVPVPECDSIEITGTGTETVGLSITPLIVKDTDDTALRNPDEGSFWRTYAKPGMDRVIVQVAWAVDAPGQVDIQAFVDGVPKTKTLPVERTELERTLAMQLNDIAGSFVVRNFQMKADDHPSDATKARIWIGPGRAYPMGWPVETYDRRYVDVARARDTLNRNNSTVGDFSITGATVVGTATGDSYTFNSGNNKLKLMLGFGNSHTVTLSGSTQTAAQVCTQIEDSVNAYKSSEAEDLVTCTAIAGAVSIKGPAGKTVTIQSISNDCYTLLGLTAAPYSPSGQRIYPCNDYFVKDVSDMEYSVEIVEQVTHNGNTDIDALAHSGVSSILGASIALADCHDGKYDWHVGVDFQRAGDTADFAALGGSNPNAGATIYIKYRYNRNPTLASRVLVKVTDATVTKGVEDGADNLVFTGGTYTKVKDGTTVTGLSGSASDVVQILRVNNTSGQSQDEYNSYALLKNSTALAHATSQIDWSAGGTQGVTPGGQPTTDATYCVTFTYWQHATEGDYVAANSYDIYESIEQAPGVASEYNLRDCIDWRTTGILPRDSSAPTFDYNFYLARYDKITIDPDGNFTVLTGTPAIIPVIPNDTAGQLTLQLVLVPPYTYFASNISLVFVQPVRLTQQGLYDLQKRIATLEYWQTVNDLEHSVAYGPAASGSRGIFADALTGLGRCDVSFDKAGVAFTAAVDTTEQCVRLPVTQDQQTITPNVQASTGVRSIGNSLMLDFEPEVLQTQTKATGCININPDDVVSFAAGDLSITPAIDVFTDTEQLPDLNADYDNGLGSALQNLSPDQFNGIKWGAWDSNIPQPADYTVELQGDPGSVYEGEQLSQMNLSAVTGDRTRTGISSSIIPTSQVVDLGNRVVDMSMTSFMRTKNSDGSPFTISIDAKSLIPNGDYAVSIGGKVVDATATSPSTAGAGYQGKASILANASGSLLGTFEMPLGIPAGQQVVKVFYAADPTLSSAMTNFYSAGFQTQEQNTTIGFQSARVRSTVYTQNQAWSVAPSVTLHYLDPLAQTFIIDQPNTYVAGVGIFFCSKSATIPVTCEIREVWNGYPTQNVLASRTLLPGDITPSEDASEETVFWFENVLGYQPNEYAVVLKTNCTDYSVWMAEMGKVDLTTNQMVMAQAAGGVLFHSPNGSTWQPMTQADLTFKLYKGNFENDCQIVFSNLTGLQATSFVLRVEQFLAPGTRAVWAYSLDSGVSWVPFIAGLYTGLSSVVTAVSLRVDVTSIGGTYSVIDKYMGILFLLHDLSADAVWNQIEFTDNTALPDQVTMYLDIDADGTNGSGARSVTPYYSIDDGLTWVELAVPTDYAPLLKGSPYYEYLFQTPPEASISDASNESAIVITSVGHGFKEDAVVYIAGVEGNTNANGTWRAKDVTADTFKLVDPVTGANRAGNAGYTQHGTINLAPYTKCRSRVHLETSDQAQTPKVKNIRLSCVEVAAA